jgi:diguanylate cyclase (GGDEF)-like protein
MTSIAPRQLAGTVSAALVVGLPLLVIPDRWWPAWILAAVTTALLVVVERARAAAQGGQDIDRDPLTGLANRAAFLRLLQQACEDVNECPVAVLLVELDRFKDVNDSLGHSVGDALLVQVAERLSEAVRPRDAMARVGGDEFAVVAYGVESEDSARHVASALTAAFDAPFMLSGLELSCRASTGIALGPRDGSDVDVLLRRADVAVYDAKAARGAVAVYDGVRDDDSLNRLTMVADLRPGIRSGALFPVYQPQCGADTGEVTGVEALARWRHPTDGVLSPATFMGPAESAGVLSDITDVLLAQALVDLQSWHGAGHRIGLSLNISPRTLEEADFVTRVDAALHEALVDPSWLTLEITEDVMVGDSAGALLQLAGLRRLGCRISIDDFGTGYSSLSYLKQLPANELKIDRSFVLGLGENRQDETLVRAIVELGHKFGLTVIGEGVESDAAWGMLAAMGCDQIQGYRLARPMTADALSPWLEHHVRVPAARGHLSVV